MSQRTKETEMTVQEVCDKVLAKIVTEAEADVLDPAKITALAATYEMLTRGGRDD